MDRYGGIDAYYKINETLDLLVTVVLTRDHQIGDFDVNTMLMAKFDGIENRLEAGLAHFLVK